MDGNEGPVQKLKLEIYSAVRKSFISYQKRWVTTDSKQLRENWIRFKRFLDAEIGD